jgi:hypothetical protein
MAPFSDVDNQFGLCPYCRKTDGYMNLEKEHWFACHEHKVRWWGGRGIFSTYRFESELDQWRNWLKIVGYTVLSGHEHEPALSGIDEAMRVKLFVFFDDVASGRQRTELHSIKDRLRDEGFDETVASELKQLCREHRQFHDSIEWDEETNGSSWPDGIPY